MNATRLVTRGSYLVMVAVIALAAAGAACEKPTPVTYYRDVQPILAAHCTGCHHAESPKGSPFAIAFGTTAAGIAPFPLVSTTNDAESYELVRSHAQIMKGVVDARTMPPWGPKADGSCQRWKDARWLSAAEIKTIDDWVDFGEPRGDVTPAPVPSAAPQISVAQTLSIGTNFDLGYAYDAGKTDVYRCFLVDPGVTSATYLTGYAVHPGTATIVHHIIVYSLNAAGLTGVQNYMTAHADGHAGYDCYGGVHADGGSYSWIAGWAPGGSTTLYPAGTGLQIAPSQQLVIQVHYNLKGGDRVDRDTSIDLQLDPPSMVSTPAYIIPFSDTSLDLTPNDSTPQTRTETYTLPVGGKLWGVAPHMHLLGRAAYFEDDRAGDDQCLLDEPLYRFNWQQMYFYEEPLELKAGDTIKFTCTWDTTNSGGTTPINFGEDTTDEMCIAVTYVTAG